MSESRPFPSPRASGAASASAAPLVTVERVSLFLPGDPCQETVLHGIDWQIARGDHCAVLGPNGSGKSTLLRLGCAGSSGPRKGISAGTRPLAPDASPLAGRTMSALVSPALQENYQRRAWDITGRDLLLTGFDDTPLLYTQTPAVRQALVEKTAARLQAGSLLDRLMPTLSQGQLRLLLLGRALVREPALLLLDEWAEGLDHVHRRIFAEALEACAENCTVILTAHRGREIPTWCKGRRYMEAGRLHADPPATSRAAAPRPVARPACRAAHLCRSAAPMTASCWPWKMSRYSLIGARSCTTSPGACMKASTGGSPGPTAPQIQPAAPAGRGRIRGRRGPDQPSSAAPGRPG